VVSRTPREVRRQVLAAVLLLYSERIARGECKNDPRDQGREPHAAPTRNKRRSDGLFTMCEQCYQRQLAYKRKGNTPK
jgi:hypothetical protein